MDTKNSIALSPLGLRDADRRLLQTICTVSEDRDRPYYFVLAEQSAAGPAIWIVDEKELPRWHKQHRPQGAIGVVVAPPGSQVDEKWVVRRPITPSRFLAALDSAAQAEMGSLTQVVINDGTTMSAEESQRVRPAARGSKRAGLTALVVDDSPTVQSQIEFGLRLNGGAAVCVDSGEKALAVLNKTNVDIVFLGVMLPGADGYQVCRTIRHHPANKHTPVVMLTSKSSAFDRVRGVMVGCDNYLTKPLNAESFNHILARYVSHTTTPPARY